MTTPPPRDWDKELADIDKLIAGMPAPKPEPAGGGGKGAPRPALPGGRPPAPQAGPAGRVPAAGGRGGLWLRVGLGVLLGAGMTQWPYAAACGLGLMLYLGAVTAVVLTGWWSAVHSWRRQVGWAHVVSLAVVAWGLVLAAGVVLPRIGYAARTAAWWCA